MSEKKRRPSIKPGDRFGSLTIVAKVASSSSRHPRYDVACDCGRTYQLAGTSLGSDRKCRACCPKGAERKYNGKLSNEYPLYLSWVAMRHRCNPAAKRRQNYRWAARGIKVCEEWSKFPAFEAWSLNNGYKPGLSLDRIDVDGNYSPDNCQWVTRSENSRRARAEYRMERIRPAEKNYYPIELMWGAC